MIAITGAAGQLGRGVTMALAERISPTKVTLGTRDPAKLQAFAAQGFRITGADFDKRETLETAFDEAKVVLIICADSPNHIRMMQHRTAIDAAKRAGVRRVVYTSFVNPGSESLFPFALVHDDSESYLRASGLSYTILRNNQYFENLNGALTNARTTGILTLPGASGKVAYISRADIAAATAAALVEGGDVNRTYQLTGSNALDLYDVAKLATEAWGRNINAAEMSAEDYRKLLQLRNLPSYAVDAQVGLRLASGAGEYCEITDDARQLTGRRLETLRSYLMR